MPVNVGTNIEIGLQSDLDQCLARRGETEEPASWLASLGKRTCRASRVVEIRVPRNVGHEPLNQMPRTERVIQREAVVLSGTDDNDVGIARNA